jgi:hypothetical protein
MEMPCEFIKGRSEIMSPLTSFSFVSSKQATQDKLAFTNSAGNAIMKVDNSSSLNFQDKRNAIRISTTDRYTVGSLWVADILHLPYGVSIPSLQMVVVKL